MIRGIVTQEGEPVIDLDVSGQKWKAIIDTGFNGDLELPESLGDKFHKTHAGFFTSFLAGGRKVRESLYNIRFPFEGRIVNAEVAFAPVDSILIGTRLLKDYRLEIDFVEKLSLIHI